MKPYTYRRSIKADPSDELVNTYLLRPIAGLIVRAVYPTRITPNHLTIAAIITGCVAAGIYAQGSEGDILAGGLTLTLKDILDSADGQLARAREEYSRLGRFLDSIGDFVVNGAVFFALWILMTRSSELPALPLLLVLAFISLHLRVSYHVYYQTAFLQLGRNSGPNRLRETVQEEDRRSQGGVVILQYIFQILYGWQDRIIAGIDRRSMGGMALSEPMRHRWYSHRRALRLTSFLGLGTELLLLTLFSIANALELYLFFNLIIMNGVWGTCIALRRFSVRSSVMS